MTAPQPPATTSTAGSDDTAFADDLALATELADAADRITMAVFRSAELQVMTKPDRTPVTEADQAVERMIRERLAAARPADTVLGEEFGATGGLQGRSWIIDPIDGTANYLRGVPIWATLIGLVIDGTPTLGMVSAPAMGRRWWAAPGVCATRDVDGRERDLGVSQVATLGDAHFSYSDAVGWPPGALDRLQSSVWRTRGFGDFYSHLLVAEGSVDIGVEPVLAPWDVAALLPIVTGAGGQVTGTDGEPVLRPAADRWLVPSGLVSTNRTLHNEALRMFDAS